MTSRVPGFDRVRQHFGRVAYGGVVMGLCVGASLHLLHQREAAGFVLGATCGLLMAVPIMNLVVVFAEELRRRDWVFAAVAAAVLALLGYATSAVIALHYKAL